MNKKSKKVREGVEKKRVRSKVLRLRKIGGCLDTALKNMEFLLVQPKLLIPILET